MRFLPTYRVVPRSGSTACKVVSRLVPAASLRERRPTPQEPRVRREKSAVRVSRWEAATRAGTAITVAALHAGLVKAKGPTVGILSGGNIEFDGLRALLGEGGAA